MPLCRYTAMQFFRHSRPCNAHANAMFNTNPVYKNVTQSKKLDELTKYRKKLFQATWVRFENKRASTSEYIIQEIGGDCYEVFPNIDRANFFVCDCQVNVFSSCISHCVSECVAPVTWPYCCKRLYQRMRKRALTSGSDC